MGSRDHSPTSDYIQKCNHIYNGLHLTSAFIRCIANPLIMPEKRTSGGFERSLMETGFMEEFNNVTNTLKFLA
jgi:hypothetical protein